MSPRCAICSEENVEEGHEETKRHLKNDLLDKLNKNKHKFSENSEGIVISCTVCPTAFNAEPLLSDIEQSTVKVSVKPREEIKFTFTIRNNNAEEIMFNGVMMMSSDKLNFSLINDNIGFGTSAHSIPPNTNFEEQVRITFENPTVGLFKMSIYFCFANTVTENPIIIMKEMVVFVETVKKTHKKVDSPFTGENIYADKIIETTAKRSFQDEYVIPSKDLKKVFARNLKADDESATDEQKALAEQMIAIFEKGPTRDNYTKFFHNLLWYDETVTAMNLKNYNMSGVALLPRGRSDKSYALRVPGLAEKRPSLMRGDFVHVRPNGQTEVMFQAVIAEIEDSYAVFAGFDNSFKKYFSAAARFDVRFFMSRVPLERMHAAVDGAHAHAATRVYPMGNERSPRTQPIANYYNGLVAANAEQRSVVEHIVAGSSGSAPYLLFGPAGTGKTVTIVEAILQLAKDPKNRILVCTDSNKAADHVASVLVQYRSHFTEKEFILRANSEYRTWDQYPATYLGPYSNGTCRKSYSEVSIGKFMRHRIVITTLIHAAKFARQLKKKNHTRVTTHVFIDEAAQASEPATLVPVCGLLAPAGQLVLAGDPMQLGPVCISRDAKDRGLGLSLMERLKKTCPLYRDENRDPNFITMLKKNFRSHADILGIPNELFYNMQLEACAPIDNLSQTGILDNNSKSRAIMFEGILSQEQREGRSPSFYNNMELEIVQKYIRALVERHGIDHDEIGIVTPYIRQVYKIKEWLVGAGMGGVEVGTVEGFQGKEKRAVVVSTVRANCDLFAADAKFRLGFVADDKRFNVVLTRAKAKLIVIGNPMCLKKDNRWKLYMQRCREYGTYSGFDGGPDETERDQDEVIDRVTPLVRMMLQKLHL